jgi:hypothetical protein
VLAVAIHFGEPRRKGGKSVENKINKMSYLGKASNDYACPTGLGDNTFRTLKTLKTFKT